MKPTPEQVAEVRADIVRRVGRQTFAGKLRQEVDEALNAQLHVLDKELTPGEAEADYDFPGNDFVLGAAVNASDWLYGQGQRAPNLMWPNHEGEL